MSPRRRAGQGLGFLAEDAGERAVYVVSVAAELAGMHPQTLRQYDRLGLVSPARTRSRGRRYSHRDVERLRRIQALSQEGVNLEGIRRIIELEKRVEELQAANAELRAREAAVQRIFAAAADGEVQVMARSPRTGRGSRTGRTARGSDDDERTAETRPSRALIVRPPRGG
ncbi:heat shock protein transcriptional repressor HspR [Actinomyces slackii]|uniref:HTH-type transcriptional regulator glnR n=1 Tax=Actinomyces slackii TaxID=52774 RepID=A0A448K9I0_9ACTO|nr:helix-turn-helix transcriptional regulator [Actinomyces slackii]VEG73623.1 HTH-type transcriptional regulator glnR [Actinomyces slackii]